MSGANAPDSRAHREANDGGPAARTARRATAIQRCITRLVQEAPAIDAGTVAEFVEHLLDTPDPGTGLARSIAQVVELVAAGRVDPGIALPHLAMACATLADPTLTTRELEAARYEIDTLLPVPGARPASPPDVPLAALTRGPRPRPRT